MAPPRKPITPTKTKRCPHCATVKPGAEFNRNPGRADGLDSWCSACQRTRIAAYEAKNRAKADAADARAIADREAQARRIASDHADLRPEDFDVSVGNDRRPGAAKLSAQASRDKRQEYSERMGDHARALAAAAEAQARGRGDVADNMPGDGATGSYIADLGERERRFGNRRIARSVALFDAGEALALRMFKEAAREYLHDRVTPTGYARKAPNAGAKRSVSILLSDLHFGAELSSIDEPVPFGAIEEARRLEYVLRQVLDYKPQYRRDSECVIWLNGDVIEGLLMHDLRSGAPLVEQKMIFWRLMRQFVGHVAAQYPRVRVVCQPGNHGRDKVRHPGRATARKWDSHETEIYLGLREMCSSLANVAWQIDFRAASVVNFYGAFIAATHGDTEVKLGHPDTRAKDNARALDRINSTRVYGCEIAAWLVGHFHSGRYLLGTPRQIFNAALIPPNGYARGAGYLGEACGQFLFESVEGHPIGDVRFLEVGPAQDADDRLGKMIEPFRFNF